VAFILEVMIVDAGDGAIKVGHQFFGLTEAECEEYKREHLASCEYFRAAEKAGNIIEDWQEIDDDELPDPADFDESEDEG